MFEMSPHFKYAEYAPEKHLVNVKKSTHRLPRVMQTSTPSFIGRHSKSSLTVSNEMMRQSIVSIASSPCVCARATFVTCMLALMQSR